MRHNEFGHLQRTIWAATWSNFLLLQEIWTM